MDRTSTRDSLHRIFNAESVAVVGASADPAKLGYMTLDSIIKGGYQGRLYPVNPKCDRILDLVAYPSLLDIPDKVELAVVIVPAPFVPGVMRDAAAKGITGAVILSAGFREAGRADLEDELLKITRPAGIRFVGPNVQGINYLPNRLCAMFFPVITCSGPLAVITQSGSATAALAEWAAFEGLGISAAINLGNQTDLCESDYLDYFAEDPHTKTIAMYIEGVGNGRRFLDSLERATHRKPVVVLKSGRSEAGRRAVSSHTGALAGSQRVFEAACRAAGAVVANHLEDLFDRAKGLAALKSPSGNRVLSISTSGGMSALAADGAEAEQLVLPPLPEAFRQELIDSRVSPLANMANPLDLGYQPMEAFRKTVLMADRHDFADVILLNFGDPMPGCAEATMELAGSVKAALAVNYLGGGEQEKADRICLQRAGIPVFPTPDRAMKGIGAAVNAAALTGQRSSSVSRTWFLDYGADRAPDVKPHFFTEPEALRKAPVFKSSYPSHGLAQDEDQAVQIACRIGFPVVAKLVSPDVPHKSEIGGVTTGLKSEDEVRVAFQLIQQRALACVTRDAIHGILICREKPSGLEAIVGAMKDPIFGPCVMFGLGGVFTEIMDDVVFRIAPLTERDAEEMVREIKGYPLLTGARGRPTCDLDALRSLLLDVSGLIVSCPEILELDLNPVRLFSNGLSVLDIRMMGDDGNHDFRSSRKSSSLTSRCYS